MKIIGISGKKQSGKNTVANYINGDVLHNKEMVKDFYIDNDGKLVVQTTDANGELGFGVFDVTRKDSEFTEYAHIGLWPYIKIYHFADPLKEMAINLFGLNPIHVYGNDDDKNQLTDISWDTLPNNDNKTGLMTVREFLEYFGTKIIRKIKNNAWSKYSLNRILGEQSQIAIVPDVRFPNEVEAIKDAGGIVIRLTRNIFDSKSEPEVALDKDNFDWSNFDLVIDNSNITLEGLCEELKNNTWIWR